MREHKQGQPAKNTEVRHDRSASGLPPVEESELLDAPERTRPRRVFQVGPYTVETKPGRSSC